MAEAEYDTVYVAYEMFLNRTVQRSNHDELSINLDDNMKGFQQVINKRFQDGWRPLGPPTFTQQWFNLLSSEGFVTQTLVRDKADQQVVPYKLTRERMLQPRLPFCFTGYSKG
jgi:hypothetical protein